MKLRLVSRAKLQALTWLAIGILLGLAVAGAWGRLPQVGGPEPSGAEGR